MPTVCAFAGALGQAVAPELALLCFFMLARSPRLAGAPSGRPGLCLADLANLHTALARAGARSGAGAGALDDFS